MPFAEERRTREAGISLISDAVLPRMARPGEIRTPVAGRDRKCAADSIRERPATGASGATGLRSPPAATGERQLQVVNNQLGHELFGSSPKCSLALPKKVAVRRYALFLK